ncbi:hypothetical protein [Vulcanococcus limneticus]|uniref:hypothetical protein n=1 Tax=Vulcanococcus limneticus TaxID=2170428 RepID=UPI00398C1525
MTLAGAGPARLPVEWMLPSVEVEPPTTATTPRTPHQRKQTTTDFAHDTEIQQQRNNHPSKRGESNAEKNKNSPRNFTFKINSLQLLVSPCRSA